MVVVLELPDPGGHPLAPGPHLLHLLDGARRGAPLPRQLGLQVLDLLVVDGAEPGLVLRHLLLVRVPQLLKRRLQLLLILPGHPAARFLNLDLDLSSVQQLCTCIGLQYK